jgi:hypothetical protein
MDQMKRKAFESDPVPSTLTHEKYRYGTRDAIFYSPIKEVDDITPIDGWLNWIASDDPRTKEELRNGQFINTFPSKKIRIPVNKEIALQNNIIPAEDANLVVPYIDIELSGDILYKNRLLMMDIIATNNWERPIYFTGGSFGDDDYLWMKDYLQLDGVCFKLIPINTPIDPRSPYDMGRIDADKSYDIIKKWYWGNSGNPDVYHDRETRSNGITYRGNIARVVEQLIIEEKPEKAKELMDLAMEKMPVDIFEFYTLLQPYISGYYEIGETQKARDLWDQLAKKYQEQLTYYSALSENDQYEYAEQIIENIEKYRSLVDLLIANQDEELVEVKAQEFNNYLRLFSFFYDDEEEAQSLESLETLLGEESISIPAEDTIEKDTIQ